MRATVLTVLANVVALVVAGSSPAAQCAQPLTTGTAPKASDCLFILKVAVGAETCVPECICAPRGTPTTTASDALLCLKKAVGQDVALNCQCAVTTTTLSSTTTTLATTTTLGPTTTTTGGGNIELGRQDYDSRCSFCHAAGSYDPDGEVASDLAGDGDLLVPDLGTIDSLMDGIMLSDPEIANMAAFLDSLQ